jgi:putative acetyltransferase
MTNLIRTTSDNSDFQSLVKLLDEYLAIKDGNEHSFYAQYNKIAMIKNVIVYYHNEIAAGCGAFKEYDSKTIEIKRMFVHPDYRNKGIGTIILNELESWAKELNYSAAILETGKRQPEAIRLYQKASYNIIPNYGQYANVENSVCMRKHI